MKLTGKYNHKVLHKLGAISVSSNDVETNVSPDIDVSNYEATLLIVTKKKKLSELKSIYIQILYKNHDIEDKIEALAGLKTAQEILEIKNWLKAVRYIFNQVKTQINNAIDVTSIEAIDVSYNAILGQVEAYYLTL